MSHRTRNRPRAGEFGVSVSSRDGNRPSEGEFGVFVSDREMETTQVWETRTLPDTRRSQCTECYNERRPQEGSRSSTQRHTEFGQVTSTAFSSLHCLIGPPCHNLSPPCTSVASLLSVACTANSSSDSTSRLFVCSPSRCPTETLS